MNSRIRNKINAVLEKPTSEPLTKSELARRSGYTRQTVIAKLQKGLTQDQILQQAKDRENNVKRESAAPGAPENFTDAQTRKEIALANLRELEYKVKAGELIQLANVNEWLSTMILRSRDVLLRIAPELKDKLAQEQDPINVELMIDLEVRRALQELAKPLKKNVIDTTVVEEKEQGETTEC